MVSIRRGVIGLPVLLPVVEASSSESGRVRSHSMVEHHAMDLQQSSGLAMLAEYAKAGVSNIVIISATKYCYHKTVIIRTVILL